MKAWWILLLAACEAPAAHPVPGIWRASQLRSTLPAAACGTDISFGGPIALRYRYLYDAFGRLAFARGTYTDSPYEDTIAYRWDNLDQLTGVVQRSTWDGSVVEIEALYSSLGDLVEYTWRGPRVERHRYEYDVRGLPDREIIEVGKLAAAFELHYDATNRIVLATGDASTTVYTYDDDARTITIDTDDGAFVGVIEYDGEDHQLAERWSGSDPMAAHTEQLYTWSGDRLDRMTSRSGDDVQIETYLYACDSGR